MATLLQHQTDDAIVSEINAPILFRLPNAWFVDFLSEWLDWTTIVRLDTATSPHNGFRRYFLHSLQDISSRNEDSWDFPHDECSLRWLSIRRIPVESITLSCRLSNDFLKDMQLHSLRTVSIDFVDIDDVGLSHLLSNHSLLVSLYIHEGYDKGISDRGFQLIGQHLPLLERLSFIQLSKHTSISCTALISVFRACANLKAVSLTDVFEVLGERKFSNADLLRLREFAHLFEDLEYSSRVEGGVSTFVELLSCCPQLTGLTYNGSSNQGEETLDAAGDTLVMSTAATKCRDLKMLDLCSFNFTTTPIAFYQNLHELRLTECDMPVSAFTTISAMKKLEILFIDSCRLIDVDASIELLARGCPNLTAIQISQSQLGDIPYKISPRGLVSLLKSHSQRLESVDFSFEDSMLFSPDGQRHQEVAMEIAEALSLCPFLRGISIFPLRSDRIILNDQCLRVLCGRCTQLKTIMFTKGIGTGCNTGVEQTRAHDRWCPCPCLGVPLIDQNFIYLGQFLDGKHRKFLFSCTAVAIVKGAVSASFDYW